MTDPYSGPVVWVAEGHRLGIIPCPTCGAAIVLDPHADDNPPQRHNDWHAEHDAKEEQ
jgi:hypothetical protein